MKKVYVFALLLALLLCVAACAPQPIDASEAYEAEIDEIQATIDSLDERLLARTEMDELRETAAALKQQNEELSERADALEKQLAEAEERKSSISAGELFAAYVTAYDEARGTVTYDRIEIIDESDAARVKELNDMGVHVAFTDGVSVRNDFEIIETARLHEGARITAKLPTNDTEAPVCALITVESGIVTSIAPSV